jgi:hypothetical protein
MRGPGGSWRALRGHVLTCFGPSECRHARLQKSTTSFCDPPPRGSAQLPALGIKPSYPCRQIGI